MPWYINLLIYLLSYLLVGSISAHLIIRHLTKLAGGDKLPDFGTEFVAGKFKIVDYKKFMTMFSLWTIVGIPVLIVGLFFVIYDAVDDRITTPSIKPRE